MQRQICETVLIANAKFNVLNVKDQYNRCRIPNVEIESWRKKNPDIGTVKKKRFRIAPQNPSNKRRKVSREDYQFHQH